MNIGTAIREIRKKLDMSQNKLADKCGITQTSLSQIENGLKRPSSKTMGKICAAMEIPEMLIYIMAMQEEDVPEHKRDVYKIIYPTIVSLALQMISSTHVRLVPEKVF